MAGRLSIVGTPIGNLEDVSRRAERVLGEADVVYCEDTRRTRKLFAALGIPARRLVRLDANNESTIAAQVVSAVTGGQAAVLVSDAGMPAISDPGSEVVRAVSEAGCHVEVVPGPSAAVAALALSGLAAPQYRFYGFLPRKGAGRARALGEIGASPVTSVIYEAANRVAATVSELRESCEPGRPFVAARELTKVHEEVWRGTVGAAFEWISATEPRGEWVLIVGQAPPAEPPTDSAISDALNGKLAAGTDRKTAVAEVSVSLGVPKRRVYELSLHLR